MESTVEQLSSIEARSNYELNESHLRIAKEPSAIPERSPRRSLSIEVNLPPRAQKRINDHPAAKNHSCGS